MLNLQMLSYYMTARHLFMTGTYGPPTMAALGGGGSKLPQAR